MARRRRKGNPLLTKILVVSLAVHAVALPIAAHFGAFKNIQKQFGTSRVVMVSLPPEEKEKPKEAHKAEKKTKTAPAKKVGGAPKSAVAKSSVPQPKVVASAAPENGAGGDGATVDANATGKAGALPPGAGGNGPATPPPTNDNPPPPSTPVSPPPVAKVPEAVPKPEPAKPAEPAPAPRPRRIVEAATVEAPEPTIPDELRTEPFEKTLVVEADVDTGGHPTNVKIAQSTGTKQLDDIGLDTARRYRFKPATVDDEPVQQHVRFRIVFKVE